MNPLPKFLNAVGADAANARMREGGRKKWSRTDYNLAAKTINDLVQACYRLPADTDHVNACIRFGIAAQWEAAGYIDMYSDWKLVMREIDRALVG